MHVAKPVNRRALLKLSLATAGSAAATALLAACGGETATTAPTIAATTAPATRVASPTVGTTSNASAVPATSAAAMTVATSGSIPASVLDPNKKITLDYWYYYIGVNGEAVRSMIKRFSEMNPNVTIAERNFTDYQTLVEAIQAGLAAKTSPTVAHIGSAWLNYAAQNLPHLTIDDAAKRDAQGRTDFLAKNFSSNVLDLAKVEGVQHGMPYSMSIPLLYYNVDLFAQAGLSQPPRTWAEVREFSQRIKDRTGKFGFHIAELPGFFTHQALLESNGARLLIGSGASARTGIDSPEAIEAMQFSADMILKDKTAAQLSYRQSQDTFTSGEIAMYADSVAQVGNFTQNAKFKVGTTAFPVFGQKPARLPIGGGSLFIFATDPVQQAAGWEFIKYLNAPEPLTTWIKALNVLPTRQGLAEDPKYLKPFYDANPLVRPALDSLSAAVPQISWPGKNGLQATKELVDARDRILSANQDTASALKDAAARINQIIKP